jgi:hypothetical protein
MESKNGTEQEISVVDIYYKKTTRVVEYYVIICFIVITIFPLFEFSWIPLFIKFIYFTGFPLLILLILIGLVKDPILNFFKRFVSSETDTAQQRGSR